MTSLPIEYVFCQNIHCSLHALFLAANPEANSDLKVGDVCPICGVEKIASVFINAVMTVLGKPASSTDQGTVLKGLPYGGMVLQRGDDDATQTWGGTKVTDARHSGALYVAELQKDLVRLSYYGPARGGQIVGKFNLQVMASVLNVKQHLVLHYGIPGSDNFDQVQRDAAAVPVTPTTPPAPSTSSTAPAAPAPGTKLAIYYPANATLASPAEALGGVSGWSRHLGAPGGKVPLLDSIKSWAKSWEQLQSKGVPTLAELAQIREQTLTDQKFCAELTGRANSEAKVAKAFSTQVSGLKAPHQQGTLSDGDLAPVEAALGGLVAASDAVGKDIPDLLTRVRATDQRLPKPAAKPDPGNQDVTLVPSTLSAPTLEERYQRLVDADKKESGVQKAQSAALTFAQGTLSTFKKRADEVGKLWDKLAAKETLIREATKSMETQTRDAADNAAILNSRSVSGKASISWPLRNARNCTDLWLSSTGNTPPQTAGSLEQIEVATNDTEARWTAQGISTPNPGWSDVNASLGNVRINLANFNAEITKKSAESWDSAYSELLKEFGRVDLGTARHIRSMVTEGSSYGTNVFRTPQGDEIITMKDSVLSKVPELMDRMLPEVKRKPKDGPLPLLRFIYMHESGAGHSYVFAGIQYVKVGVDWPNSETSNAWFSETATSTTKLSTSRGWGATQFTTFETNAAVLLKDSSGNKICYDFHGGIPFATSAHPEPPQPLVISSVEENVAEGTKRFLQGFIKPSRECSFRQKYKCSECAKQFTLGPSQVVGGGVHQFTDPNCDFERVPGRAGPLYRIRSLDTLRKLLASNDFTLSSGRNAEQAIEADRDEFPCSWLAAVIRYASVSPRGYYYMLEALETLQDPKKAKVLDPP